MQKTGINVVASKNFGGITLEDLDRLDKTVQEIKVCDNIIVPIDFYDEEDMYNKSIMDYVSDTNRSDEIWFLYELLTKQKSSDDSYGKLFDLCNREEVGFLAIKKDDVIECIKQYTIVTKEDIPKVKRVFLCRSNEYSDVKERVVRCYPRLIFHPEAFNEIHKLGDVKDNIKELDKNLSVLNDFGEKIYKETGGKEGEALKKLASIGHIICSGKGSNENTNYKKEYIDIVEKDGDKKEVKYNITCNPHTKMFKAYSNKRIYFSWGRDEIKEHNLIIVKIGGHWKR